MTTVADAIAETPGLDIEAVQSRADAVLGEALYWFPVRHHSPGVTRHLREALRIRRPKIVFIEGPAHASDLVKFIVDSKTKPPVALYCSYRDDNNVLGLNGIASPAEKIPARFASWYPLLPYSPEYVTMKVASQQGADVVFIDLPHHALLKTAAQLGLPPPGGAPADAEDEEETEAIDEETASESAPGAPSWENLVAESGFFRKLTEVAGYKTWDEAWDSLFELGTRHADHESFRRDMAYFCSAVRATAPALRMATDGTIERERHMWQSIQRELTARNLRPEDAMVVCGGFHLFMARDEATPAPTPPQGTVYSTVAPYSYFRTSELAGYGAGNRAPRYYQLLWDYSESAGAAPAAIEAMVEHVVSVLKRGRKTADGLSSADAISVTQHARLLATLRGRAHPVLDDIRDALLSCCCKGRPEEEGAHLLEAMEAIEVGTAVGRVTPDLGRLPLVHDFYQQIDVLDLGEVMGKDKRLKLQLDLREDLQARRSVLFHRLTQLGVPLAECTSSSTSTALFQEAWQLKWSPKVEAELIEKNLYGDSIEAAATAMLDEELAKEVGDAEKTCERLVRAVNMDLSALVTRMEDSAGTAIDTDARFPSLARALTHLEVLNRLAAHRRLRRDLIADLEMRAFGRACFAIPGAANVPPEEQKDVIQGLLALEELVLGDKGQLFDRDLFIESVRRAYADSTVPFMRGAFVGTLTEVKFQKPEQLAEQVAAFANERPEVLVTAGEFLEGVLSVSRTSLMFGAEPLVDAIDRLLRAAPWDLFVTMLPRIRNAFEQLHQRQRHSLADRVAAKYGLQSRLDVTELKTTVASAAAMAKIDQRVAEIMKGWEL